MSEQTSELVQKHIQDLRSHPHIEQIIEMKPFVYKIVYWPQDLDSLYSQMPYTLKLSIPEVYPQKPPFVTFLNKIYHLNVHPTSGQVCMSILKDDWSPFLNLKAVISSLDQILQQPDEHNAANQIILEEYQNDISTYVQKVKQILLQNNYQNQHTEQSYDQQEVVEEVIDVNDFTSYKIKNPPPVDQNIRIDELQSSENRNIKWETQSKQQYSFNESRQVPQSPVLLSPRSNNSGKQGQKHVQIARTSQLKPPYLAVNSEKGSLENIPVKVDKVITNNHESSSFTKYQNVIKESRQILNPKEKGSMYQGLKINMARCRQLINIFSEQLSELQQNAEKNKGSKRLKKLFEDRCTKVEDMIVELFEISEKTRVKLMETVRKDFTKYQ